MPSDEPHFQLARVIRELRARHDYSQEELGRRAGLHRTNVTLIESGEVNPSWDTVCDLADALGVTIAELAAMTEARL